MLAAEKILVTRIAWLGLGLPFSVALMDCMSMTGKWDWRIAEIV